MPRQPIHAYWKERIKHHLGKGQRPQPGPTAIERVLIEESREFDSKLLRRIGPVPSNRSIARILKEEWVPLPEEEKLQYREFYYPESMERGDLPWEASAACLELLGYRLDSRPTIRMAMAFWRITLAAPDLNAWKREMLARVWSGVQALGEYAVLQDLRNLESYLAYAPWKSEEANAAAVLAHEAGEFDMRVPLTIDAGKVNESTLLEVYAEKLGSLAEAKEMMIVEENPDSDFGLGEVVIWRDERVPYNRELREDIN